MSGLFDLRSNPTADLRLSWEICFFIQVFRLVQALTGAPKINPSLEDLDIKYKCFVTRVGWAKKSHRGPFWPKTCPQDPFPSWKREMIPATSIDRLPECFVILWLHDLNKGQNRCVVQLIPEIPETFWRLLFGSLVWSLVKYTTTYL